MFVSQIDSVPSLSAAIQARREARGLSQAQLARMAGLSVNTVSRWEQGRFRPKGKAVIAFLKDTLDFTQDELDKLFLEWVMRDARSTAPRIEDASFLTRSGLSYHDLLDRLLEIDFAAIPQLTPDDGGEAAHWAPIFEAQPHTWRLLVIGDYIIGYWHVLHLKRKVYEKLKSGQMSEGQLRVDDLANWSAAYTGVPAHLFISAIVVEPQHQHPHHGMMLIRALLTEIDRLIVDGFAITEFCTVAYSPNALHLCRSLGMERVRKWLDNSGDIVADVHIAHPKQIMTSRAFNRIVRSGRLLDKAQNNAPTHGHQKVRNQAEGNARCR